MTLAILGVVILWHPGQAWAGPQLNSCFNQGLNANFTQTVVTQGQPAQLNVSMYDHPAYTGRCADLPSHVFYDLGVVVQGPGGDSGSPVFSQFFSSGLFGGRQGDPGFPNWEQSFTIDTSTLQPGTYEAEVTFVETSYWPSGLVTYDVSHDNSGGSAFDGLSDATSYAGSSEDYPETEGPTFESTFTVVAAPKQASLYGYLCSSGGGSCSSTYYASPGQTVEVKAVTEPQGAATQARAYNQAVGLSGDPSCFYAACLGYAGNIGYADVWTKDFTAPQTTGSYNIAVGASWKAGYTPPPDAYVTLVVTQNP